MSESRERIILAAVELAAIDERAERDHVAAGGQPSGLSFEHRTIKRALDISILLGEKSEVSTALERLEGAATFVGTVVSVSPENNTGRGLVKIRPRKSTQELDADGTQTIKTDPHYTSSGAVMIRLAQTLVGHDVLAFRAMESFKDKKDGTTKRMNVLAGLHDLGLAGS